MTSPEDRRSRPNPEAIAHDWAQRGFSCELWVDSPRQHWEDFVHTSDELLMLVEGRIEVEISGERRSPEIGEEVFIPRGAVHSVRTGDSGSRWLFGYRL